MAAEEKDKEDEQKKDTKKKKCKDCYYCSSGFCLRGESEKVNKFVLLSKSCDHWRA